MIRQAPRSKLVPASTRRSDTYFLSRRATLRSNLSEDIAFVASSKRVLICVSLIKRTYICAMAAVASSKDDCEDNDVVIGIMLSLTEVIDPPSESGLSGFVART